MPPSMEYCGFDVDISSPSGTSLGQSISAELSLFSDSISQAQWHWSPPHAPSPNPPILSADPANTTYITDTAQNILRPSTFDAGAHNRRPNLQTGSANTIMAARVRRRTQNREAQKKFRERKEQYLKNLEEKAKRLEEVERRYEELFKENEQLKLQLQDVERKLI
ncbi:hypothetical protein BKA69DRAFT_1079964 [Paraphysoderma sedebokerense]|nr:hypothetical protein BKA69DRAFT_1079964 [Paraphysoderma sedebokerense]